MSVINKNKIKSESLDSLFTSENKEEFEGFEDEVFPSDVKKENNNSIGKGSFGLESTELNIKIEPLEIKEEEEILSTESLNIRNEVEIEVKNEPLKFDEPSLFDEDVDSGSENSLPGFEIKLLSIEESFYEGTKLGEIARSSSSKSLTKTASAHTNDPLYLEAFSFPGVIFTPVPDTARFTTVASGYMALIEETYNTIKALDGQFSRQISLSVFSYYCVQAFWARICALRLHYREATHEEEQFKHKMEHYVVPAPIRDYLAGMGEVVDPDGNRAEFRFKSEWMPTSAIPATLNFSGFHGPVNNDSHYLYENFPYPGVAALRICYDYARFNHQQAAPRDWPLPPALTPAVPNAGGPTPNLLGWSRAIILTKDQNSAIESSGVQVDLNPVAIEFPSQGKFVYNRNLMEFTLNFLRSTKVSEDYTVCDIPLLNHVGSVAQIPWVDVDPSANNVPQTRTASYVSRTQCSTTCTQLDTRFVNANLLFAYRVRKEDIDNRRAWSCYDFGDYQGVPGNWSVTRNTIYTYGHQDMWNRSRFRTPYMDIIPPLSHMVSSYRRKK